MRILPISGLSSTPGVTATAVVARVAPGQPVQATQRLEGAAGHDPKLCEHCLAGARHEFSADGDEVVVSAGAGQGAADRAQADGTQADGTQEQSAEEATRPRGAGGTRGSDGEELSEEELQVVRELSARDREVRAHEQAHLAAAGPYATGGPSFTYQTGPDGQRYAVGGEVGIDTSPVAGDPQATLNKARAIMAAASAPAEPSSQDRAVAAAAAAMAAQAQAELTRAAAVAQYGRGEGVASQTGATISIAA